MTKNTRSYNQLIRSRQLAQNRALTLAQFFFQEKALWPYLNIDGPKHTKHGLATIESAVQQTLSAFEMTLFKTMNGLELEENITETELPPQTVIKTKLDKL